MQREYFCGGCGLFHWADMYTKDEETGRVDYVAYEGCPNEECFSHKDDSAFVMAVDTMAYFYFSEVNGAFVDQIKWSSPRFAPQKAVEVYKRQGFRIID